MLPRARLAPLLVAFGVLLGAAAPAQAQSQDSAVGKGEASANSGPPNEQTFDFSATSGPSGENPSGFVKLDIFVFGSTIPLHVEGPVTCLSVSGKQAVIGFELDPDFSGFPGAILEVTDNGPPGSGPADVFNSGLSADPTSCEPGILSPILIVFSGDIVVTDAPVPPTSKEQCRDGGYVQFGFKNQGQCVAFVARGAEP